MIRQFGLELVICGDINLQLGAGSPPNPPRVPLYLVAELR